MKVSVTHFVIKLIDLFIGVFSFTNVYQILSKSFREMSTVSKLIRK